MDLKEVGPAIIILVLVGLILTVGIMVFDKLGDTARVDTDINVEEHVFWTINYTPLANTEVDVGSVVFMNQTSNETVDPSSFTYSQIEGNDGTITRFKLTNDAEGGLNSSLFWVNYTYGKASTSTTAMLTTATSIDDFATWIGTIIVLIGAAVVIFIIRRSFKGAA